jgi:Mn-dependent DtxR family transcriptional regulator
VQGITDATIRHVIAELLNGANEPDRVGRRVLMLDFALRQEKAKLKQLDLAKELQVSPPTVNVSLVRAKEILSRLREANFSQKSSNGEAQGNYF